MVGVEMGVGGGGGREPQQLSQNAAIALPLGEGGLAQATLSAYVGA